MRMHRVVFVLVLVLALAVSARAQLLVPAGGMSAGCPAAWGHRDGSETSFSCADTSSGAFCNGRYRAASGATQADEALAEHARIVAMGFVIQSESDEQGMHVFVNDDAAHHRIAAFVRGGIGRSVFVTCGTDPSTFAAELPTFVSVASSAR